MENSDTNTATVRKPIDVVLLSLLTPGLGHVYAGKIKKGLLIIALLYAVIYGAGMMGVLPTFNGIVSLAIFVVCYFLYAVVSALVLARKTKRDQLHRFTRWYFYLAAFCCVALVGSLLSPIGGRMLGVKVFSAPSVSMSPTIQVGEYLSVDTRNINPDIGDVVVYRYPSKTDSPYIARVAAVSGDNLTIENGTVFRFGQPEGALAVAQSNTQSEYSNTMAARIIPEDELFLLGDNRDNSNDSRSRGTVRLHNVVGNVRYVLFSKTRSRIAMEVE